MAVTGGVRSTTEMSTSVRKSSIARLKRLWAQHDRLERQILLEERKFTDQELRRLGAAAGSDR